MGAGRDVPVPNGAANISIGATGSASGDAQPVTAGGSRPTTQYRLFRFTVRHASRFFSAAGVAC
jgi:hypothetical protein